MKFIPYRFSSRVSAESTVLLISIATVIGPTPPETGVIYAAFLAATSKFTSPVNLPPLVRLMPTSITVAPCITPTNKKWLPFVDPFVVWWRQRDIWDQSKNSMSNYLLICQRYIELNPVRAGMVEGLGEYVCSSYKANGLGQTMILWTTYYNYLSLGSSRIDYANKYRDLFVGQLEIFLLEKIRSATNQSMALGNDKFRDEIEILTGRRVRPMKRGPKKNLKLVNSFYSDPKYPLTTCSKLLPVT